MDGWYRTSSFFKKELKEPVFPVIFLPHMAMIELVIPSWAKEVNCSNNFLTELIIPDSVWYINCRFNNLTELVVPDNCVVNCDDTCKVITRTMYNRSKRLKNILK